MCSENPANLKTVCVFNHRINDADISNVDEVFDAINAMAARSTGILNSIGNLCSRYDQDLFWSINAAALEIQDILEIVTAHYEARHSGGAV